MSGFLDIWETNNPYTLKVQQLLPEQQINGEGLSGLSKKGPWCETCLQFFKSLTQCSYRFI